MLGHLKSCAIVTSVLCATSLTTAHAQVVTFSNPGGQSLELHVRNGPTFADN
jgi:hypothetical protein